jgi:hypothetical protein
MPPVLRIDGWRVVIYPNDHAPAHVHVLGPGWVVVVNLIGLHVREAIRADERTANEVLSQLAFYQDALLAEWKRFHD